MFVSFPDSEKEPGPEAPPESDPGEGFGVENELAEDISVNPAEGFGLENHIKALTSDSYKALGGLDLRDLNTPPDPEPTQPDEGFDTDHEIRSPKDHSA